MAERKMGAADLEASSAARFMLSSALSTNFPMPNILILLSISRTCLGNKIFTAASLKNPSVAESLSVLFCAPRESASFKPETISSDDKPLAEEEFFEKIELAFLNKPPNLLEESFCAEREKERKINAKNASNCFMGTPLDFYFQM